MANNKTINLTAKSASLDRGEELIPLPEIADRVLRGEVIVIPQCLQAIGYFDRLREASLAGIRQIVGEEKAAKVRAAGFEAMHAIVEIDKLTAIVNYSYEIYRSLALDFAKAVVENIFGSHKPFYYEADPNVRYHIPYDEAVKYKELNNFNWSGKITAHCPHHDSWYDCPTNSINVWFALGSVKRGNGLCLYPRVYGKRLPCTSDGKTARNQYYGEGLNFELAPGDAIVFHGEHLHSSEINSTDETRHGISLRLTLDKPKFLQPSPFMFIHSGWGGRTRAKLARMRTQATQKVAKMLLPKFTQQAIAFDDTSASFPAPLPVSQDQNKLAFDEAEFPVGSIRPISPKACAARLQKERIIVFSRYCPHEGADLAAGSLQDGCVVCPWHNLPLNLNSGASPCKSLSRLTAIDYTKNSSGEWHCRNPLVTAEKTHSSQPDLV